MILDGFSRKKVQKKLNLEICLEMLRPLAVELLAKESRAEDYDRWRKEIDTLTGLIDDKNLVERHLSDSYQFLFIIYKDRHNL